MKKRFSSLFALLLVGCLFLAGCLPGAGGGFLCGGGTPPSGWSGPVVGNDTLYVGSMTGRVIALEDLSMARAKIKWQYPPSDEADLGYIYGTPCVADGVVYVGAYGGAARDPKVYAIDSENGWRIWAYPGEGSIGPIIGSPVIADGVLYVGSSDSKLYAIDIETGRDKWWPFETGDDIWAAPVVHDGVVYIGSFDQKLYALNAESGVEVWHFDTGAAIASTPLIYNDTIYVGSFDRKFYALNLDGTEKWDEPFEAGNWFWGTAIAYHNTIIAVCLDGRVYALDADTGYCEWYYPPEEPVGPVRGNPALVGDVVVFGSEDGKVYALDASTGQELWHYPPEEDSISPVRAPICAGNGVVYVHASNQKIYSLEMEYGRINWSFSTSD